MKKYILVGKVAIEEPDLLRWAEWMQSRGPSIALFVEDHRHRVSTVFLGIDLQLAPFGPPHLFETMVFSPDGWDGQQRWSTYAEAMAGHTAAVQLLQSRVEVARVEALDALQELSNIKEK